MATNTLLTQQAITNEVLMRFKNNLGFSKVIDHTWDDKFAVSGAKIGDTLRLREAPRYAVTKGAVMTPQNTVDSNKTLTLDQQAVVGISFSSVERTLSIDQFSQRYLESAAVALANQIDVDGLTMAYQFTGNSVGDPATIMTTLDFAYAAGRLLDESSTPVDGKRYMVVSPKLQEATLKAAQPIFNSQTQIASQYTKGRMGEMGGFTWIMDQNVRTHTYGARGGTPQVGAADQTGSTLAVTGFSASAAPRLSKGDTFTLPLVYKANYLTGDSTGQLQVFTVTANVSSLADGSASIPISPPITPTGVNKTVTASPAAGAPITFTGVASSAATQNIAFHKSAFVLGMAPLQVPANKEAANAQDPDTGVSIRTITDYDILNDQFITRIDCLYGWAAPRSEWAVRVLTP